MMFSDLSFWIFAACVAGFVVGVALTIKSYRDAKYAAYFFLREEAALRVKRLLFVLVPLAVIAVFLGLRLFGPASQEPTVTGATPTQTQTATLSAPTPTHTATAAAPTAIASAQPVTVEPAPSVTTAAALTVAASPTGAVSPTIAVSPESTLTVQPTTTSTLVPAVGTAPPLTATQTITETASPTPTVTDTPVIGKATPSPDLTVGPIIFSRAITSDNKPRDPDTVFSASDNYLYAFFEYHRMTNGVAWSHTWLKDNESIAHDSNLWSWGTDGRAYVFSAPYGGYTPGKYELRIYIGDKLVQSGTFEMR